MRQVLMALLLSLVTVTASAQTLSVGEIECLPNEGNAKLSANVAPEISGSDQVRLYFRRLNPTGAYYWVEMNAEGDGSYWAVFPKPEHRRQQPLSDEWWEILQNRGWMEGNDREWLEEYLENHEHEAAEFFVAITDAAGQKKVRSSTTLVPVQDSDDCGVGLNVFQAGQASNLTVGETTELQQGRLVFHWLCDGIVSRRNADGVLRGDDVCRGCVIAGWLPAPVAGAALIAATTIEKREPREISRTEP